MTYKNTFILSLGGSLIVPSAIDTEFLSKFKVFIESEIKKGNRFVIISGGGATARAYRDAGLAVVKKMPIDDLDWLGIHATRLNAHLIRTIFRGEAYAKINTHPQIKDSTNKPIIIGAGYRPGCSTDYDSTHLAKTYGAQIVINMSNIDYVYDKDPRKPGAKKIEEITWKDFRKIVGNKWDPGLHAPFDPIASKFAQKNGLEVYVLNGKDLKNLKLAIDGKKFIGTIIRN
ncbi:MAG: putative uridylate kinase, uridylate kinase [Candidatus Doudnabacteria bacterium]|nr:putative uridylate kinase, uridylate kinase [Candidatus Doudnabacteria bacterium]